MEESILKIPINKDLEKEYKDQFIRGFSAKECGYIAIALACVAAVAVLAERLFHLPYNICFYIGLPFGVPAILIGFKEFQGLTFFEYVKELIFEYKTKELYYDADEIQAAPPVYKMSKGNQKKEGKKK